MNRLKFILILLIVDLIISNLIFKNSKYWEYPKWNEKWWRVSSLNYHHTILPNIDKKERWGERIEKRIITNSLGFIDTKIRKIEKKNTEKKRILLIGDSFIEGSGVDYKETFFGLLSSYLGKKYEILNSAVGSYSPSIYYKKTKFYIEKGYEFNQALVFLDVSDIYDELFVKFDSNGNILTERQVKNYSLFKKNFYSLGRFLRDNTITFRFLNILSDRTELFKEYIKLKIKASNDLNKSFFNTDKDDVMFYRMTHIDRGFWTFNEEKYKNVEDGIKQSEKYLLKLFNLLKENNIDSTLIIYPWPTQILYGDKYHENYWKNFSNKNKIKFLSVFDEFQDTNKRDFIFENFIYGDIHWNKKGTKIVFNEVIKNINFD